MKVTNLPGIIFVLCYQINFIQIYKPLLQANTSDYWIVPIYLVFPVSIIITSLFYFIPVTNLIAVVVFWSIGTVWYYYLGKFVECLYFICGAKNLRSNRAFMATLILITISIPILINISLAFLSIITIF